MNIYEKFENAKNYVKEKAQKGEIGKTGKSDFTNSTFVKLEDLQPVVDKALKENKLFARPLFITDIATYEITNLEDTSEQLIFTVPMVLKGLLKGSEAQSLGASLTYMRRYMLLTVFELNVPDEAETEKNFDKHDIWVIQKRLQKEITEKYKNYEKIEDFYKAIGTNKKALQDTLGYCNLIAALEKKVKAL